MYVNILYFDLLNLVILTQWEIGWSVLTPFYPERDFHSLFLTAAYHSLVWRNIMYLATPLLMDI